jgi:hypothetical protein
MPLSLACSLSSQAWPASGVGQRPLPELQQQQRQARRRTARHRADSPADGRSRTKAPRRPRPWRRRRRPSPSQNRQRPPRARRAGARVCQDIVRAMPLSSASARKPAASASDTRFEIVMVKRSLAAANAIRAGNSRRRAMSRIMGLGSRVHTPAVGASRKPSGDK